MCPPPTDPIRPLLGHTDTERIERIWSAGRVGRRGPVQRDDGEGGGRRHAHQHPDDPPPEPRPQVDDEPLGTYDDHGRSDRPAHDPDEPVHPHVDRSA